MALLQLCSQPTAFFAALEVDCKSLTLRHCGTWLETQRCNFTMPKRKLLFFQSVLKIHELQLYHAKAETSIVEPHSCCPRKVATLPGNNV